MKQRKRKKRKKWFAEVSSSGYLSGVKSESNSLRADSAWQYSSSWRSAAWQLRGGWGERGVKWPLAGGWWQRRRKRGLIGQDGSGEGWETYRPNWRRRNDDERIRAKLMAIFYSGSARSSLSNTVITSLVRTEGGDEGGRRRRRRSGEGWRGKRRERTDSILCHCPKWIAGLNWVVTSEAVVLTLQRDEMEEEEG